MNKEKQRVKIAESCGWKFAHSQDREVGWEARKEEAVMCWIQPENSFWQQERLPDYLNDLNAMHEAEKMLTEAQRHTYTHHLHALAVKQCNAHMCYSACVATASRRSEAFLRTLNLWEDAA